MSQIGKADDPHEMDGGNGGDDDVHVVREEAPHLPPERAAHRKCVASPRQLLRRRLDHGHHHVPGGRNSRLAHVRLVVRRLRRHAWREGPVFPGMYGAYDAFFPVSINRQQQPQTARYKILLAGGVMLTKTCN